MLGLTLAAPLALTGCDTLLDTDPASSVNAETAFDNPDRLAAAVNGMYSSLQGGDYYGSTGVLVVPDLITDDHAHTGTFTNLRALDTRNLLADNASFQGFWTSAYSAISRANFVLARAGGVPGATQAQKDDAMGNAYFVRALSYLHLAQYFGGVPLVLEPLESVSGVKYPPRATQAQVYAQVEQDLGAIITGNLVQEAGAGAGVATASVMAARALRARAYLYQGKWAQARADAEAVIASGAFELLGNYAQIFESKNSREAIFELQYNNDDSNFLAFQSFPSSNAVIVSESGGRRQYAPTASLYNAYTSGDPRRTRSMGIYNASNARYYRKYFRITGNDDNVVVLRLAEMHLIRAEAAARTADLVTALDDVNAIRARAGQAPVAFASESAALTSILAERRRELVFEGHRFYDLKRYFTFGDAATKSTARAALGFAASGAEDYKFLFPIPQREIDVTAKDASGAFVLVQNPGY